MRNAKLVLIVTLAVLQVALAAHLAVAAPVAHGRFNEVTVNGATDPEYAAGGQRLSFSATAVNDGDSTGWFTICVVRVDPPLTSIWPSKFNQVYKEYAVNCNEVVPTDPGGKFTFVSNKWLMLSVPVGTSVTFWVMLFVQQQEPIPTSDDGSDYINLTIDELRVVVLTSF